MNMTRMVLAFGLIAGVLAVRSVGAADEAPPAAGEPTEVTGALAEARGRIGEAIESSNVMASLMKGLSASEQRQFLADVNKAIADMPASTEEKTAKFLNANHAALKAAKPGNLKTLLAEMFATVTPEALTVLNERFADDLFSRTANPDVTYTDEQFSKLALEIMAAVNERVEESDNASVRSAFAILMFVRASGGTPADLTDKLIETIKDKEAREMARTEWIPSALGKDQGSKGYEPILASADAGRRPDLEFVLVIAGPQYVESVLSDLIGKNTDEKSFTRTRTPILDAVENPLVYRAPVLGADYLGAAGAAGDGKGAVSEGLTRPLSDEAKRKAGLVPTPTPTPEPQPEPYPGTRTY